jgi:hypothetical protein
MGRRALMSFVSSIRGREPLLNIHRDLTSLETSNSRFLKRPAREGTCPRMQPADAEANAFAVKGCHAMAVRLQQNLNYQTAAR